MNSKFEKTVSLLSDKDETISPTVQLLSHKKKQLLYFLIFHLHPHGHEGLVVTCAPIHGQEMLRSMEKKKA